MGRWRESRRNVRGAVAGRAAVRGWMVRVEKQGAGLRGFLQGNFIPVALDENRARLGGRVLGANEAGIARSPELFAGRLLVEVAFQAKLHDPVFLFGFLEGLLQLFSPS